MVLFFSGMSVVAFFAVGRGFGLRNAEQKLEDVALYFYSPHLLTVPGLALECIPPPPWPTHTLYLRRTIVGHAVASQIVSISPLRALGRPA